jgi:hypothetical protein
MLRRSATASEHMTAPQYRAERAASSSARLVAITVAPGYPHRLAAWTVTLPGLDTNLRADLEARYRLSNDELRAVAAMSRAGAPPEIPATYRAGSAISMADLIAAVARRYHRDALLLRLTDLGEYAPLLAEVAHG